VVVNLSGHESHGLIDVGPLPPGDVFYLVDRLADVRSRWSRSDLENGLYARLSGGDAHLLAFEPA